MAVGGGLLAVAPFMTWVSVVLLGSLNLFQIYSASADPAVLPWLVVISAGAVVVLALANTPGARIVAIVVGFLAGGVGSLWAIGLANSINNSGGFASIGVGPFAAVAGAVTMIVAGFRAHR